MTTAGAPDSVPGAAAARTGNVLGALALAITDQTHNAVTARSGQSASSASALSALHGLLDRPTVDQLRKVLGLTPSGAVRLVDRLADAGLATRGPGTDGRTRSVSLTAAGRQAAAEIAAARAGVLSDMVDGLTARDLAQLDRLLSKVMGNAVRTRNGGAWICRMCEITSCEGDLGNCPAADAARTAHTPDPATRSAGAWSQRVDALQTEVARVRKDRKSSLQDDATPSNDNTEETA